MKTINTVTRKIPGLIALVLTSQHVLAGSTVGSITHESTATGVPMLGGAGLMVMAGLLALVSLRFLKERGRSGSFLVVAAMAGAIASAGGGLKLINDAQADVASIELTEFSGGEINIPGPGFRTVTNSAGSTQQITDIDIIDGCFLVDKSEMAIGNGGNGGNGGSFRGACDDKPGTLLEAGDFCDISVACVNGGGNGGTQGGFNGGDK